MCYFQVVIKHVTGGALKSKYISKSSSKKDMSSEENIFKNLSSKLKKEKSHKRNRLMMKDSKLPNPKQRSKHIFTKQEVELNNNASTFVKITPQTRAKLERIPNKIGPYECKLCKVVYSSAFTLAMHNCPRIFHLEYKCTECDKVFNSPANLASHKRWHKPKLVIDYSKNESSISLSSNEMPMTSSQSLMQDHLIALNTQPATSDWLTQFYSNYLAVAAQSFLTSFPNYSPFYNCTSANNSSNPSHDFNQN